LVARRAAALDLMDQRYDTEYRTKWAQLIDGEEAFVKQVLGAS
jgi:hypothetical protein